MALQLASNAALPWAVNRQRPLTALLVSAVSIGVILSIACFEQGRFWITRPTRHAMLKHRWTLASLNEDSNSTSNTDTDEDGNAVSDYDCDCRETLKSGCLEHALEYLQNQPQRMAFALGIAHELNSKSIASQP
ncbi:hypothetical protein BASA81_011757 [Batrachochytrium salamandrivorans]|nr:hypothetical protein BASA81_011757 [Batrachochytrium salamandrivorans]